MPLSSGRVEEVMSLPADAWTATFLGAQTPLVGTVIGNENGLLEVDTGTQVVTGLGDPETVAGARVFLGVRPEDVTIFEAEAHLPRSTARNLLHARIVDLELWGVTNHVVLDIGGQTISRG
jgi:spermidine/putrescine transport system ATP-binding protein